jgi:hypothetical protein
MPRKKRVVYVPKCTLFILAVVNARCRGTADYLRHLDVTEMFTFSADGFNDQFAQLFE